MSSQFERGGGIDLLFRKLCLFIFLLYNCTAEIIQAAEKGKVKCSKEKKALNLQL